MTVVNRFAPSPTGMLHVGGARTALFNWLFSRHHGGTFLLRIEDTDRARSTPEAVRVIIEGLRWLGIDWDGEPIFQSTRFARHAEAARALLAEGKAYLCFCTPAELAEMREAARREGRPLRYDGRWRDRDPGEAPPGVQPAIRLKAPTEGETVIDDLVQGEVRIDNRQLDDMVLLRADGTPTYMHSVVVDDHDMAITHVIRGDDHLTNAFRQVQLFNAFGWPLPRFAHIPLIHGADGAKLSKRHGAVSVLDFRAQGYLPEALCNYLLRLGWAHGDDEIISREQAVAWFDLAAVGRSAARFDYAKLTNLNAHYLREAADERLLPMVVERIEATLGRGLAEGDVARLRRGLAGLKLRARTVVELAENALLYVRPRPLPIDDKAARLLAGAEAWATLAAFAEALAGAEDWSEPGLEALARAFAEARGLKLAAVAQPLRAALTGATVSPGIFEVMVVLGRDETVGRIRDRLPEEAGARGGSD
ncbi:MAG: glutamate--tRNA ligase [Proteobacteria bacterium]|nr:glutamate--tRNA ligase [Pseudomonadota bacterium]